jgi:hypothetical protein
MQFSDLDKDPETGAMPISAALLWLHKLIGDPAVNWNPEQRAAAQEALDGARVAMTTQVTVVQKPGGGFVLEFVKVRPNPPPGPKPALRVVGGTEAG